jgi:hypothetical protein
MADSIQQLQSRWDTFLARIEQRFHETLAEAAPACLAMLRDGNYEITPMLVGWQAIKSQCMDLITQIGDTWTKKVSPAMEAQGYSGPGYDWSTEAAKCSNLEAKLLHEIEIADTTLMGQCAQAYYDHVLANLREEFRCSQCGAPVVVESNIYRSHYLPCPFCATVNTYNPSTKVRGVEWFVVDHLASYRCLPLYQAMMDAANARSRARVANRAPLEAAYQQAALAYWDSYLLERIRIVPELAEFYEADRARRLREIGIEVETAA